jgi:hypothetical protein
MEAADRLVPGIMANIAKTNGYCFFNSNIFFFDELV